MFTSKLDSTITAGSNKNPENSTRKKILFSCKALILAGNSKIPFTR
jgi:hypothetical protein